MEWKQYKDRFEVSDTGQVRNSKTKREYSISFGNGAAVCSYREHGTGKHLTFNVAQTVYKLFVDNSYKGSLYHKDGCKLNNAVENLIPSITSIRQDWQIEQFNKYAYPTAKFYYKDFNVKEALGDLVGDDYIQESVILMWKYLPNLKRKTKFVTWGKKYCRFAFLVLLKKERQQKELVRLVDRR